MQEEDGPKDRSGLFEQVHLFCVVCGTEEQLLCNVATVRLLKRVAF